MEKCTYVHSDSIHRARTGWKRDGCHPSQSFLRFCAEECFFNVLIDPPITRAVLTSRSYPGQSVRVEIFLQRDLGSPLPFRRGAGKPTVCTCAPRPRAARTKVVRDGYSPPKVWHVSGGAQVSALTAGRALENDIAGRVITGRCVLSRGQHPENKREFTVSVSFWHGPL